MTDACREFGISRKTRYKIYQRYQAHGLEALCDRSRRPVRYANQLPPQIEDLIVRLKRDKLHWGARKIRELLVRRLDGDIRIPAKSTVHAVLHRHGLVKAIGRPRHRAAGTPLSAGAEPNDLWCADYKGEFKLGNGRYCYPLTVSDHASRFPLLCEALESTREEPAIEAFEQLFAERGLPLAIRSDNGAFVGFRQVSIVSCRVHRPSRRAAMQMLAAIMNPSRDTRRPCAISHHYLQRCKRVMLNFAATASSSPMLRIALARSTE
jgi:transposase InsO family protein